MLEYLLARSVWRSRVRLLGRSVPFALRKISDTNGQDHFRSPTDDGIDPSVSQAHGVLSVSFCEGLKADARTDLLAWEVTGSMNADEK